MATAGERERERDDERTGPLRPGLPTSTPSLLLHPTGQSKSRDQPCFRGWGTRPLGDAAELRGKGGGFGEGWRNGVIFAIN